jgi:hypothetical protein
MPIDPTNNDGTAVVVSAASWLHLAVVTSWAAFAAVAVRRYGPERDGWASAAVGAAAPTVA